MHDRSTGVGRGTPARVGFLLVLFALCTQARAGDPAFEVPNVRVRLHAEIRDRAGWSVTREVDSSYVDGACVLRVSVDGSVLAIKDGGGAVRNEFKRRGDASLITGFLPEGRLRWELSYLEPWAHLSAIRELESGASDAVIDRIAEVAGSRVRFAFPPVIAQNGVAVTPIKEATLRNGAVVEWNNYLVLPDQAALTFSLVLGDFDPTFRHLPRRLEMDSYENSPTTPSRSMVVTVSSIEPIPPGTSLDQEWSRLTQDLEPIAAGVSLVASGSPGAIEATGPGGSREGWRRDALRLMLTGTGGLVLVAAFLLRRRAAASRLR